MSASAMLGSNVSLQGLPHSTTDIPKEYHRKLLKKIAQLTKVIYVLNTKNDENDDFVQSIRAQHKGEVLKLSSDWLSKLEHAQEECRSLKEAGERRTQDVARELEVVKCERDNLKSSELQMLQLQELSSNQMKELGNQLNQLKREHAAKVEEVLALQSKHTGTLKAAQAAHKQELDNLRLVLCGEKELVESELERTRRVHVEDMGALKQQWESRVQSLENALLAAEGKKWQERLEAVQRDTAERENALSHRVSQLSTELRVTKDRLTLSEQKVRDLEAGSEEHSGTLAGLQSNLADAQDHARSLQSTLTSLHTELNIAKEKYNQQCAEMLKMSNTIGKLEGLRVCSVGEIENHKSSISELKQRLSWLEMERETLASSQKASEQSQLKIKNLEREVGRLIREKQELHTQYAHEIEAAHSQLNEREHQLEAEHVKALQEIKAHQLEASATALKDRASEIASLRKELEGRAEVKMATVVEKHQTEVCSLQGALAEKSAQLASALSSLERVRKEVEEKKDGLGTVSSHMKKLTQELDGARLEVECLQKQLATEKLESERLKLTLKELRDDHINVIGEHKRRMDKVQADLTHQLEEHWSQRLREECGALRDELAHRHKEDMVCALAELSTLKDRAMRDAVTLWNDERNKLVDQVASLEKKLDSVQCKTQLSLENVRTACDEQVAFMRREMEASAATHEAEVQRLVDSHKQEITAISDQHQTQTEAIRKGLLDAHANELQLVQQSNLLCIKTLQEEWKRNQAEEIHHLQTTHSKELDSLCCKLQSKFQAELASEKERHQSEMQLEQRVLNEKCRNAQKEIAFCQVTIRNLEAETERKDSELAGLKDKVSDLIGAVNKLRKELEVKGQEILTVRREANTQVQLQQQQLSAAHRAELDSINKHNQHRIQGLLNDFNKAKELLIQKIGELERKYLEAEEKHQRRESRPEDLEEIQKLKASVVELQSHVKEMAAELRIYQLELANREKNYNKLFGVNPLVGVLDPMAKKKATESVRHSSAPSLMEPTSEERSTPPQRPRHLEPIEPKMKAHRIVTLKDSDPSQSPKAPRSSSTTHAQPLPVQL